MTWQEHKLRLAAQQGLSGGGVETKKKKGVKLSRKQKIALAVTAPLWVPLSPAIVLIWEAVRAK
jgi:hypothetical protein